MKRLPLLCALIVGPLFAFAEDSPVQSQLNDLKKLSASSSTDGSMPPDLASDYREFSNNFSNVESNVQNGNPTEAIRYLRRWISRTKNDGIKKSLGQLLASLEKEQQKQTEALAERFDALIKSVRDGLATARTEDEVQALRDKLDNFRDVELYNQSGAQISRMQNKLSNTSNGLEYWQRFVADDASGSYAAALQDLRNFRDNSYLAGVVSKETVANRYQAVLQKLLSEDSGQQPKSPLTQALDTVLAGIKTPADIPGAADKVAILSSSAYGGRDSMVLNRIQNSLSQLAEINAMYEAGDYARVVAMTGSSGLVSYSKPLNEMQSQLRKDAMQKLVSQDSTPQKKSPSQQLLAEIMAGVKSPSDAVDASDKIAAMYSWNNGADSSLLNRLQNSLNQLAEMNERFESGEYARVISASIPTVPGAYLRQFNAMQDQLKIAATIKANDLPDLGPVKPGESFASYLRRTAQAEFEKKDWATLYALLSVYSTTTGGGCARTQSMQGAVASLIAGQQLEEAGQFGDAVAAYTRCLTGVGPFAPRAEATAALNRLRSVHPEAFKPTGNLNGES